MKAMILAAGAGTRLDPLTLQLPKPLVPIVNRPVMEHTIRLLKKHDFKQIWANLYHLPELISSYFEEGKDQSIEFNYLVESELSGDAGGVRACRNLVGDGTLLVIMGDLITNADLSFIIDQHKNKGALASIALKTVDDVSQFGVAVIDKNGWIKEFQEKPDAKEAKSNLASTGIYILEPAVFDFIPASGKYGFGKQLFPDLVNKGLPVLGIEINSYWSDVGTFDQYRQTNFDALDKKIELDLAGEYKEFSGASLWSGHNVKIDPSSIIEGKILLGNNVVIGEGASLSGHVVIGNDCIVESGAKIKDSVIWSASRIGKESSILNSVIGLYSYVEPKEQLNKTAFVTPQKQKQKSVRELLCT
jgi:mannose-1-phosphate guanylyltransferase